VATTAAQPALPGVLHCVADWGIPSERFVIDLVAATTRTSPAVVCGRRHAWPDSDLDVPVSELMPIAGRVPYRYRRHVIRALATGVAVRRRSKLLHAHFGYWAAHTAVVARRLRLPWVLSLHGYDILVMAATEPEIDKVRSADLVIVPSQFLADHASAQGFPSERIRVIPSGIDVDSYPYRPRSPAADGRVRVTFAGRFVPKKGVLDAARAMAAVSASGPTLSCRFVGYGPQESALRDELTRLRLDAEIVDGRRPDAIRATFADTDLLLTASQTAEDGDAESLGLVNIEAQACGIPVISTRHGGIPDAVAPDAGVLVDEKDVDALARALRDVASAPDRWPAMGAAGRAHAERRFRLTDRVADVEAQYAALLGARRPHLPRSRP
jgi:glycosyltransferase involved in cell wall biosynthesis